MICPKCNAKSDEGTKFCPQCGEALPERDEFDSSPVAIESGGQPGTIIGGTPGTMSGMKTTMSVEAAGLELKKGSVFAGRYEILNDGFKGGMGMVYKVKDKTLGKISALKLILPAHLQNEKAISRFKQEVAITVELSHENIVRVYDIGEAEGMIYFTMEWIDGISMRDYISERKKHNNRLNMDEVMSLMKQICSALSYAHNFSNKSIIHRDIKPENILMVDAYSKNPKLKITDFGIAKAESQVGHATTSTYMGTPIYMAPEQYSEAHLVDKRADVYSVGVILYELLTFMHPLGTFQMPSEINSSLPKKVDDIIRKALSADRTRRYEDTMGVFKDLEASQSQTAEVSKAQQPKADESKSMPPRTESFSSSPAGTPPPEKKKSMLVPVIIGVLVIILGAGGYMMMSSKKGDGDMVVSPPVGKSTGSTGTATRVVGVGKAPGGQSDQKPIEPNIQVALPPGKTVEPPAQIVPPVENVPFEFGVNLLGQREIGKNNFEEIVVRKDSTLKSNDNFKIYLKTTQDCYVYVLMFDSEGKAGMLFPSSMAGTNNRVKANKNYQIPAGDNWFFLDEKTGTETIYVIADINPMTEIDRLLVDMERKGSRQQKEDSQKILTQVAVLKRGVGGVSSGKPITFKTSDGDAINNVTQIVKGRGSLVWSVSFKHI
jgi:serine/threonine protein kinase